jgi:hypothetical protein
MLLCYIWLSRSLLETPHEWCGTRQVSGCLPRASAVASARFYGQLHAKREGDYQDGQPQDVEEDLKVPVTGAQGAVLVMGSGALHLSRKLKSGSWQE